MKSTESLSFRIEQLKQAIAEADNIIIGAGAGLSTAAGLDYAGADFRSEFKPWIEKYGVEDLYSLGFYPFATPEESWAHWAKHIWFCRYRTGALPLYRLLNKTFPTAFVVTTNTDGQFEQAGYSTDSIFATQGDYSLFQPASGNPKVLLSNRKWVMDTLPAIHDCSIPTQQIPSMPDGSAVSVNLRIDDTFVEDSHWHRQAEQYKEFVADASQGKLLLLEFGIGYNTLGIIRLPFEQMAQRFRHTTLVRFNRDLPDPYIENLPRFVAFTEDIQSIISQL